MVESVGGGRWGEKVERDNKVCKKKCNDGVGSYNDHTAEVLGQYTVVYSYSVKRYSV